MKSLSHVCLVLVAVFFCEMCSQKQPSNMNASNHFFEGSNKENGLVIKFTPLADGDSLSYNIDQVEDMMILRVYSRMQNKLLFEKKGLYIGDRPLSYGHMTEMNFDKTMKWMAVNIIEGRSEINGAKSELWFIDGRKGTARQVFTNQGLYFMVDDTGSFLCTYNIELSKKQDVPYIEIYDLSSMKIVNSASCVELQGDPKSPTSMIFKDGVFSITFSDDGPNKAILNITATHK
jgi:hypothetical protein